VFKKAVIVLSTLVALYGQNALASTVSYTPEELDKIVANAKPTGNLSTVYVNSIDEVGSVVKRYKADRDLIIELDTNFYGLYRPLHLGHDPEPANHFHTWRLYKNVSVVPVPAAVWLFGSGLLALAGFRKFNK
jgi:hypothetical protein